MDGGEDGSAMGVMGHRRLRHDRAAATGAVAGGSAGNADTSTGTTTALADGGGAADGRALSPVPERRPLRVPRPGPRGYVGPGRGAASLVEAPPEWRGTTVQVCGLWPWAVGGGSPTIGVPVGRNLRTGTTVCFDPVSWFDRGRLILNPSMFVLGLPALGKSTFVRRQVLGLSATGTIPLVLGDLKPDYVDLVRALGGQVLSLGRGRAALNVLDVGALDQAADRLGGLAAERLREEAHGRRLTMVSALVVILRGTRIDDHERTVLSAALRLLMDRHRTGGVGAGGAPGGGMPTLHDLVWLLGEGPDEVRTVTLDRGDDAAYRAVVDPLHRSLIGLLDGPLGSVFARPTTERISLDSTAVCMDVSGIAASDEQLQAAALLACWSEGFGAVEAANALADEGAGPQRQFFVVLDELWRVLRSGEGMVDRVDALTRLNRAQGVATAMISHTMADLRALRRPEDIAKAKGFVERAGAVVCGGLPSQELDEVTEVVPFTAAERNLVTSWSTPQSWDRKAAPPGQGNFLLKVGRRPGVPVHLELTDVERAANVHDTNKRWAGISTSPQPVRDERAVDLRDETLAGSGRGRGWDA